MSDLDSNMPASDESTGDDSGSPGTDEYETDSGVTVEISDVEVDVVPGDTGSVVSSQADAEAYGVEPAEEATDPPTVDDRAG